MQTPHRAVERTPVLGAPVPGLDGYVYAGVMRGERGLPDYPLAVLTGKAAAALKGTWGEYGRKVDGAQLRRDGLVNTTAMAQAGSQLAQKVLDAGAYIASLAEAQLCSANVHDLLPKGWHWTSTQDSPGNAWVQDFERGFSDVNGKYGELRAVAVRRFILQSFGPSDPAGADASTSGEVTA